jgi:hypothetical protein
MIFTWKTLKPPPKTLTSYKDIQQSSRIQSQYTGINNISINNEQSKKEMKKTIPLTIASKI